VKVINCFNIGENIPRPHYPGRNRGCQRAFLWYQNLETDKKSEKMNIKIEKNLTSKLCKAFVAEDVTSVWPNNFTPV
jgi:hypothetical protein